MVVGGLVVDAVDDDEGEEAVVDLLLERLDHALAVAILKLGLVLVLVGVHTQKKISG